MSAAASPMLRQLAWLLLVVAVGAVAVSSLDRRLQATSEAVATRRTTLEASAARESSIETLRLEAERLRGDVAFLERALPTSDEVVAVVAALEAAASLASLAATLSVGTSEATQGVVPLRFQATLTGNAANFVRYLEALEALPYVIDLTSVDLSGGQDLASEGQFRLDGVVYARNL